MDCVYCARPRASITCKYCLLAAYCSEDCGKADWFTSHKTECIGRDPQPRKQSQLTLDVLLENLANIPELTKIEVDTMWKQAREDESDPYIQTATFSTLESQRKEVYRAVVMENFFVDFMTQRGVSPGVTEALRKQLRQIQADIVNVTMDMVENTGNTDIGDIVKKIQGVTAATDIALGLDPEIADGDGKTELEAFYETSIDIAYYMTKESIPMLEKDLAKNDQLTLAFGFKPNPLLEGTDAEIRARIASGVIEKPEFWDDRFSPFFDSSFAEPIGMRRTRGQSKSPVRRPRINMADLAVDPREGGPPAHVQVRDQVTYNMWDSALLRLPAQYAGRIVAVARKLSVYDTMEAFAAFASAIGFILGSVHLYHAFMGRDMRAVETVAEELAKTNVAVNTAGMSADKVMETMSKSAFEREALLKLLKDKPATHYHIIPILERMKEAQWLIGNELLTGQTCDPSSISAWKQLEEAQNMAWGFLTILLNSPPPPGEIPLPSLLRNEMAAVIQLLGEGGVAPDMAQRFIELARMMTAGMSVLTNQGAIASAEEVYRQIRQMIEQNYDKLTTDMRQLVEDVRKVQRQTEILVNAAQPVVEIATDAAIHMPIWQRISRMIGIPDTMRELLGIVVHTIGFSNIYIVNTMVRNAPAAARYMKRISGGGTTTFFEFAMNNDDWLARSGTFLICNGFQLTWLTDLLSRAERRGAAITKAQRKAWAKELLDDRYRTAGVHLPRMWVRVLRAILVKAPRFGQTITLNSIVVGIGLTYAMYMHHTGGFFATLLQGAGKTVMVPVEVAKLLYSGTGGAMTRAEFVVDRISYMASILAKGGQLIFQPNVFTGISTEGVGRFIGTLAWNTFAIANATFRTANTAFNAYSMFETVRSFKNPFRAKAVTEPVKVYQTRSQKVLDKSHPIIRGMYSVQWFYNWAQMIWVLVMIWFAMPFAKHFFSNKQIGSKPHWATYKTRQDRRRK